MRIDTIIFTASENASANYSDAEMQAMVDKITDIYDTDGMDALLIVAVESIS